MRHCVVPSALVASLVATPLLCAGQTLLLDTNFPAGDGPGSYVRSIAVQEDGRLLVAGSFTNFNGALTPPLVRLQPDGALDTNFAAGPLIAENGLGPSVTRAVPLSDGRILIEGSFTHVSGLGRTNVALLRAGGAVDATFALPEILPRNALYGSIYPSQRAGFWVTGTFTNIGSISQLRLAKVDAAGAVDASFHSPLRTTGEIIWSLVPLPDDELLVSGQLLDGTGTAVASVVRLRPDGSVDPSFAAELPANTTRINRLALLPGGDIVAEATSASANALMDGAHSLVRWTPDGRKVATFKPDFSFQRSISDVYSRILGLWPQPDGKLIVAGTFAEVNGIQRIGLARLLADGTTDLCFDPGIGPESYVLASATQADGSILIGGAFRSFEGQSQPYLARLRSTSDCGAGAISFASDTFRVNEGSPSALIAVVRNGPVDRAETVQLSTGTGSATAGEDYLASRVNLTFAPGERVLTWSIALRPDVQLEGDESVSLHLASGGPGVQIQAPAVATLTIVDQTNYWGAGQVDTNFVVRLDAPVLAGCRSAGGGWFLAVTPTNNVGYATFDSVLRHVRTDGSIDPAFAGTNRFNGVVRTLAELPDRTILVGGEFAQVNDLVAPGLARLFPDGSVDQSYAPLARLGVTAFGTHAMVSDLLVQTDGSVVCLGSLRPDEHGSFRSGQVLVRPDGTLDPAFGRGADDGYLTPSVLVSLPDGSRLSGLAGSAVTVGRYFPKGGRDPLFLPPAYLPVAVEALAVNPDGTVLVGGSTSFGLSLFSSGLALLAPNGADMAPFRENASHSFDVQSSVFSRLLLQPDGRMLLAGPIVRGNQSASVTVIRLNPDGSWDPSFDPTTGATPRPLTLESAGAEAPAEIRYLDQLPDGAILVGGDFASFGGLPQPFLVRLQPETARPPALHLTHPAVTVLETAQNLRFEVVRSGDASKQASVFVRAVGQTAVAGVDFVPLLEQVQFAPGEWFKPVSLEVRDNTLAQANRTLELRLEEPSAGQTLAEPQRTVVTIEDDDVNVEFGTDAISVIENEGFVTVPIRRTGVAGGPLEVQVIADARIESKTAQFPARSGPGILTNFVRLPIPDDGVVSPDFATTLRLRVRQGTATVGPAGTASLRVQENDFAQSPGRGVAGTVAAIIPAATGGVYIAGEFTAVHGVPRQNVARLLPNGEVDPGFELKEGPDGPITALLLLSDGRLLIAGDFSTIGGQTRKRIARVLEDGRLDPSFDPGRGPGNGSEKPQLLTIGMLGDGRLLVGGVFQEFGGHTGRGIARLQSDGGVDTTFTSPLVSSSAIVKQPSLDPAPTGGAVTEVHPLPDGQVLVVGDLQYFARFPIHVPTAATATQPGDGAIAAAKMWGFGATSTSATALLLQPDGSIDLGFPPRSLKLPAITTISLLTNDWFLAGEAYPSVWLPRPGTNWIAVERLRLSGQPDPDFVVRNLPPFPLVASRVNRLVPQPDGKILFLAQARAGLPVSSPGVCVIGRLLPDGQWDSTFQLVTALDPFAGIMTPRFPFNDPESDSFVELPGSISSVAQQPDGVMTIGGSFTEINQEPRPRLARLQPDGELRGQLTPLIGIATSRVIDLRAGPEVPIPYVMQSSADLVHWSNLSTNASPWKGAQFELDSAGLGAWQFFRMVPLP